MDRDQAETASPELTKDTFSMLAAKLTIDARHLRTGIGTYTINLVAQLHKLQFAPVHIVTRTEHLAQLSPYCQRISVVDTPIYSAMEQIAMPLALNRARLLHVPHYNIPLLYKGPVLATIHDLTHVLYSGYARSFKSRLYGLPMMRIAANRAAHIFTVSEYSKQKIEETLSISPDKITVVYNGLSDVFTPSNERQPTRREDRRYHISKPYVLYVGSLKPHKNIETLVRAFAHVAAGRTSEFDLVIAGGGDRSTLTVLADQLHIRPVFIKDANDYELADLYRGAQVFVLPSFEEGFGLPIIEAMGCGSPVICSHSASMPEIAGGASLLFDPYDDLDLAQQLESVLSSKSLRQSLTERGLARAKAFRWRDTALRHLPVYEAFAQ